MLKKYFSVKEAGLFKQDLIAFSFLLVNALTWYFMSLNVLDGLSMKLGNSAYQGIPIKVIYNLAIILSGLCGAFFSARLKRRYLLLTWIGIGIVASLLPLTATANSIESLTLLSFWFGFSFGFGMPSCLAYFADGTLFENRARFGGVIFFSASLFAVGFVLFNLLANSLLIALLYMAIWRSLSLYIFGLSDLRKIEANRTEHTSFRAILEAKPFLFYIIPWFMFSLVDSFEKVYLQSYIQASFGENFFEFNQSVETIIGALSALFVSMIADFIGRKRVIVYGLVSLGLAYALVGLAPFAQISWYFYTVVDGLAWGVFFVMFTFVIWGDLSPPTSVREKYFALSGIPFFTSNIVGALAMPYLQGLPRESTYATFSLAAFFLFLAVVPLMYAPETLPEKKIKERQLKKYVEEAKKMVEKEVERKEV